MYSSAKYGDVIVPKSESDEASGKRVYTVEDIYPKAASTNSKTMPFKIRLLDPNLEPYNDKKFRLSISDEFELSGRTKTDGTIEEYIPLDTKQINLDLWTDAFEVDTPIRWSIEVGSIPSELTAEGASIRLRNLGYYSGDITKEMTEPLRDAIRFFQGDFKQLKITGDLDTLTWEKLKEMHDL